ncbi:PhzF family phenazine biosynthesis protein [Paracoccus liaowanqingii]|uniref:PhzF family phenazine biosynthesis protein n=1 Tax=Paracoccus liaowanqingii TaxID=2560053 RepID=A0A4Z1CAD9_9RHOB|nr:PhzF family phenazine biosynthesis protein [Paracoccus liaowanqingii]TGN59735.1 PhzF family phenazine biosynthesis protein [Paracoccus liaowanqingii]
MLEFFVYDVFTDRAFSGNPLAVVMGADALSGAQMQAIARQFNLSETIFVMAPRDPAHAARVRIFLPLAEIPFAGHPTIGCALHLAGGADGALVLEEEAGPVPVQIASGLAEFAAPVLPVLSPEVVAPEAVAAGLGLEAVQVGFGAHRPCIAHAGPGFVFAPLRDLAALAGARPRGAAFDALTGEIAKLYCYAPEGAGFRARMFAPANGVTEDPATGSATAVLAAPLLAAGALAEGETRLPLRQGVEMGRPAELGLRITVTDGRLAQVCVSGRAVRVAEGRIRVPGA